LCEVNWLACLRAGVKITSGATIVAAACRHALAATSASLEDFVLLLPVFTYTCYSPRGLNHGLILYVIGREPHMGYLPGSLDRLPRRRPSRFWAVYREPKWCARM
jgi:hypothetical protein